MQVAGICRFSWAGQGGFRRTPQDPDKQAAWLFDPTRLARRLALFEALTVPTLAAQTDPDFTLVVVTAEALPAVWMARLKAALAPIERAILVTQPATKQWRAMRDALVPHLPAGPCAQFRIDDDDGLALDYVERLRADALRVGPDHALDYTGGMRLVWGAGKLTQIEVNPRLHSAQGLALVTAGPGRKTIMSYAHHKIWRYMPMLSQPTPVMFVQSTHADQDSGTRPADPADALDRPTAGAILKSRFGLDLTTLSALSLPPEN